MFVHAVAFRKDPRIVRRIPAGLRFFFLSAFGLCFALSLKAEAAPYPQRFFSATYNLQKPAYKTPSADSRGTVIRHKAPTISQQSLELGFALAMNPLFNPSVSFFVNLSQPASLRQEIVGTNKNLTTHDYRFSSEDMGMIGRIDVPFSSSIYGEIALQINHHREDIRRHIQDPNSTTFVPDTGINASYKAYGFSAGFLFKQSSSGGGALLSHGLRFFFDDAKITYQHTTLSKKTINGLNLLAIKSLGQRISLLYGYTYEQPSSILHDPSDPLLWESNKVFSLGFRYAL